MRQKNGREFEQAKTSPLAPCNDPTLHKEISEGILKRIRNEIADYKHAVELLNQHVQSHNDKTMEELKKFHKEYDKLIKRLDEVQESIWAHAKGVQNVYQEFSDFRDAYIAKQNAD